MVRLELDEFVVGYVDSLRVGPLRSECGPGCYHLRGPNGAGKSTLLRGIAGELKALSGVCRLDGADIWNDAQVRRRVGYLASTPDQPDFLRIAELWRFHAGLRGHADWDGEPLAERLALDSVDRLSELSAGQRRKAELIGALAGDPELLLLDEPMAHLDTDAARVVADHLAALRDDRIVVVASHEPVEFEVDATWTLDREGRLDHG